MRKSFMNDRVLKFHAHSLEARLMLSVSPISGDDLRIDFVHADTASMGTLLEDSDWTAANQDAALQVIEQSSSDEDVSHRVDHNEPLPIPAIPFDDSFAPLSECPDLDREFCVPGDATQDGVVDFLDFLLLNENYGTENAQWGDGDFDGDGRVGFADLLLLASHFAT